MSVEMTHYQGPLLGLYEDLKNRPEIWCHHLFLYSICDFLGFLGGTESIDVSASEIALWRRFGAILSGMEA